MPLILNAKNTLTLHIDNNGETQVVEIYYRNATAQERLQAVATMTPRGKKAVNNFNPAEASMKAHLDAGRKCITGISPGTLVFHNYDTGEEYDVMDMPNWRDHLEEHLGFILQMVGQAALDQGRYRNKTAASKGEILELLSRLGVEILDSDGALLEPPEILERFFTALKDKESAATAPELNQEAEKQADPTKP